MCGIAGVLTFGQTRVAADRVEGMVDIIAHRGPDDAGYLVRQTGVQHSRGASYGQAFTNKRFQHISPLLPMIDSQAGQELLRGDFWNLFLGHRRLSILDLSPRGHQPMSNKAGDLWLVYNGEIYNFRELRSELEARGHGFAGGSDTEVLLRAYEEWGMDCVRRLNGMFAFALWDNRTQCLHMGRDRYGIKPLYYLHDDGQLVFGSEIKSILAYLPDKPAVDLLALNEYFSFQNILSDRTLVSGLRLLPPATVLTVSAETGKAASRQYWDFDFSQETDASQDALHEELHSLIEQAVRRQCVSDVPIGSYLSGGMDSGSVTALAVRNMGRIRTFTGGFDLSEAMEHEKRFDERDLAERMASTFQTNHYECVLHAGDLEAVMDQLIWHLEDLRVGQCYPNFYIAGLAGKFVKVVLSGCAGDELFGGYPWRYAAAVGGDRGDYVGNYYAYWKRLVANRNKPRLYNADTVAMLRTLDDDGATPFVDHTLTVFKRVFHEMPQPHDLTQQVNSSLYFECKTFLHGLLVVEDKVSMAHSLETRVPLLDNDLVDFAMRVPLRYKLSGVDQLGTIDENLPHKQDYYNRRFNSGKNILRSAMERILPPEIIAAKKQGFSAPDESWFRGRVEDYVRDRLLGSDARLRQYLDQDFVRQQCEDHMAGRVNNRLLLWSLLSFETWLRKFQ